MKPVAIIHGKEYTDGIERLLSSAEKYYYFRHSGSLKFSSSAERNEFVELRYFDPLNIRSHYEKFQPTDLNIGSIDEPRIFAVFDNSKDTKIRISNPTSSIGNYGASDTIVFNIETGQVWRGLFHEPRISFVVDIIHNIIAKPDNWEPPDRKDYLVHFTIIGRYQPEPEPFRLDLSGDLTFYRHHFSGQENASWIISSSLADVMWVGCEELIAFKSRSIQYPDIKRQAQELARRRLVTSRLPELMIEAEFFLMETIRASLSHRLHSRDIKVIDRSLKELRSLSSEERIKYGKKTYGFFESHLIPKPAGQEPGER